MGASGSGGSGELAWQQLECTDSEVSAAPPVRRAPLPGAGSAACCVEEGCGRDRGVGKDGKEYKTCCKSCPYLRKQKGIIGHDIACDIADNGALNPPWYWRSSAKWPDVYHEEVGGEYVRKMGTKLIQARMPEHVVVRAERIEDSTLWQAYAFKRAQVRHRGVRVEDVKPETSQNLDYSANTTLDHSVNEVWLLHGTSEEAARAIAKSNFACSSAGCFGSGAYFADDASKSDQYAKGRTDDGSKIMLLCRVTLGNISRLPPGQDRTASERVAKEGSCDSLLGFTNAREFVIWDTSQIYPEYVMYYKKPTDDKATTDA